MSHTTDVLEAHIRKLEETIENMEKREEAYRKCIDVLKPKAEVYDSWEELLRVDFITFHNWKQKAKLWDAFAIEHPILDNLIIETIQRGIKLRAVKKTIAILNGEEHEMFAFYKDEFKKIFPIEPKNPLKELDNIERAL